LFDPSLNITSAEGIDGYNALFSSRFTKLKKIISTRPEFKMVKQISSIISIKSKEDVFVCGLVVERKTERSITKVIIEDTTGRFEGIIFDKDLQKIASSLLLDQFLMACVVFGKNGGFIIKDIILPDVPEHPRTRSKSETYAVFLSDLHIGSKFFLEKEFERFVSWLSSPDPISRKIRFILIGGDVVDGVGIYPNQDKEIAEREQSVKILEEHIRAASQKIEENKEITALHSYPLHEKLVIIAVMRSSDLSTGEIYSTYKDLCKAVRQNELTQRRVTQMLSEIEMSGIISGRIIHQGIHGRTKKFKLTIHPDMIKSTFKNDLAFEDIL